MATVAMEGRAILSKAMKSTRELPTTVNDGQCNYVMIRPESLVNPDDPNDARTNCALYRKDPPDPADPDTAVFTPDLSYCMMKTVTPVMLMQEGFPTS
jgi:hypothetical protein